MFKKWTESPFMAEKYDSDIISNEPEIRSLKYEPDTDIFMVIGCDGLFDKMQEFEVSDFVYKCLIHEKMDPQETACELVYEAVYNKGATDNITCIVVLLANPIYFYH